VSPYRDVHAEEVHAAPPRPGPRVVVAHLHRVAPEVTLVAPAHGVELHPARRILALARRGVAVRGERCRGVRHGIRGQRRGPARWVDVPVVRTGEPPGEVGHVQLGWGSAAPGNGVQTFDFDVRADLTGRFTGTDYGDIHPSGRPASLTTDPVADPATSFTAYRNASPSKCQDPTRGVEFDAVGRGDEGDLRSYTVQVCDDDPR